MAGEDFDDALLDDSAALQRADPQLRWLAEAGARVRREAVGAAEAAEGFSIAEKPRAMVVAGADSRLLRAVLEPWCPVPFVAWPGPGLPGWAGPLDLVVVLAPTGGEAVEESAVTDALHRGCSLVVAAPKNSMLAERAQGRDSTLLPTETADSLASAVLMLQALHRIGLGPEADEEAVATALDDVAVRASPHAEAARNPAKELASSVAGTLPLLWGGSVLAARAARRIAESIRRTSGLAALAADVEHLLPVLVSAPHHDLFADPFADEPPDGPRPSLLILDDGTDSPMVREQRGRLTHAAQEPGIRVHTLTSDEGPEVARYASLWSMGSYASVYLGIGLGR